MFAAEVNTQFGSYALSDSTYKETSIEALKENKRIALHERNLKQYENLAIDSPALIAERASLESELATKKDSANLNCKRTENRCKNQYLSGSGELESKIKSINSQLELASQKTKAFDKTESLLSESSNELNDYRASLKIILPMQ